MARHILWLLLFAAPLSAAEVRTLAGKKLTGEIITIDAKALTLRTAAGDSVIPLADLLAVDLTTAPPTSDAKYTEVELTDGTTLRAASYKAKGQALELVLLPSHTLSVPMSAVASVLHEAHDPKARLQWQDFIANRASRDRAVVRRNDRLTAVEGTFGPGNEDGDGISFERSTGQTVNLPLAPLQGLIFVHRQEGELPPTLCRVTDIGRSVLAAKAVAIAGGKLTVTTVAGVAVEYPDLAGVVGLDFSKGKLRYLSDLEAVVKSADAVGDWQPAPLKDINQDRQPIRLAGQNYDKGLTLFAPADVAYDLAGDYKEFRAMLGVDDAHATQGLVDGALRISIEGDGKELYAVEHRFRDPPRPVALDVRGVRKLRVKVSPADPSALPSGYQVSLADAKVSK